MLTTALTLPLLLTASLQAPQSAPGGPESTELGRRFDLRALDALTAPRDEVEATLRVLPLIRRVGSIEAFDGSTLSADDSQAGSALLDYFLELQGVDVERAEYVEPGVLHLEADEATLQDFQRLVDHTIAAAAATPRVRVVRFRAEDGTDLESVRRGRAYGDDAIIATRTVTLFPGVFVPIIDITSDTIVADAEVQIAQGAAILEATTVEAASGFDLRLMGASAGDGVRVTYHLQHTERRNPAGLAPTVSTAFLGTEGTRLEAYDRMRWGESYGVEGGSIAGETVLRPGARLVLAARDGEYVAIELVATAKAPPALELGERVLLVRPTDFLAKTRVNAGGSSLGSIAETQLRVNGALYGDGRQLLGLSLERVDSSFAYLALESLESAEFRDSDRFILVSADAGERAELERWLGYAGANEQTALSIDVHRTEGSDTSRRLGRIDLASGSEGVIALGQEVLMCKNSTVEVAQFASISDPEVLTHFTGVALALRLSTLPDGRLAYMVRGASAMDESIEKRSRVVESDGPHTATRTRHVGLGANGLVDPTEAGRWEIVLGDEAAEGTGVRLVVRAN